MQNFKFPEFTRNTGFREFTENNKEIPISEGAMYNARNLRIFWDIFKPTRIEIERMHSGIDIWKDGHFAIYYFC